MSKKTKTAAPAQPIAAPSALSENDLNQAVGGLLPAVGPAAKPLVPAV